jgi:hypothetical protein
MQTLSIYIHFQKVSDKSESKIVGFFVEQFDKREKRGHELTFCDT